MEYEKQINEARARIDSLDASLDNQHTPFMKSQLRFAGHLLDDAESAMGHAAEAGPRDAAMWHAFADLSIQHATQIWKTIQKSVEKYGGPANVREVGGDAGHL
jgi:hypothetical protein